MKEILTSCPSDGPSLPLPTSVPGAARQVTCSKMGRGCLYFPPAVSEWLSVWQKFPFCCVEYLPCVR